MCVCVCTCVCVCVCVLIMSFLQAELKAFLEKLSLAPPSHKTKKAITEHILAQRNRESIEQCLLNFQSESASASEAVSRRRSSRRQC